MLCSDVKLILPGHTCRAQAKLLPTHPGVGPWDRDSSAHSGPSQLVSCSRKRPRGVSSPLFSSNSGRWRKEIPRDKIFPNPLTSPPNPSFSLALRLRKGVLVGTQEPAPSCAAATPCFYSNALPSSQWNVISFLPIFNNLCLKDSCQDMRLVPGYLQTWV